MLEFLSADWSFRVDWRATAAIAGLTIFFFWESFRPFQQQGRRARHASRNLTFAGFNLLVVGACCAGATVAVAAATAGAGLGLLNFFGWPAAANMVVAVILLDLWTYWWHRANHQSGFLWRFHRVHHSDTNMDVTTAVRFHAGELLISAGLRLLLIALLGLPLAALILYDGLVTVAGQLHHANVGLGRWDHWIRRLIVSPNMHKVHHSDEPVETNSNYSTVLSVWDRVFGTYRDRDNHDQIRFGVPSLEGEAFQTLKGLALTPFRRL